MTKSTSIDPPALQALQQGKPEAGPRPPPASLWLYRFLGTIALVGVLVFGVELGLSVPLGIAAGYLFYEVLHRRIHVAAPFGRYGRWARVHHLAHHFGRADANHGVTSPLWDWVFGTRAPRATVKVPRKHAAKFPWR